MLVIHQLAEKQSVSLASTYLNDFGDIWFQGWSKVRESYSWKEFSEGLCERFGEKGMINVVEEFNRLRQEGTVMEYQMKFKELKSLMLSKNPYLT